MTVVDAKYKDGYRLIVLFSDYTWKIVDFSGFISKLKNTAYDKYQNVASFKRFRIDQGNIVWGKDWDLIFRIETLYSGKVE